MVQVPELVVIVLRIFASLLGTFHSTKAYGPFEMRENGREVFLFLWEYIRFLKCEPFNQVHKF